MRELQEHELEMVSGGDHGLTPAEGGAALIGVGLAAISLGPIGLGAFAISAGSTMLLGEAIYGNHNS
ncbi:MAG: hypothetical protein MRY76_12620 [Pseudomonadales bacterium]|nr:hypothetical protein [Pseudomonadales bacterium]